jgi:hypothetical protein
MICQCEKHYPSAAKVSIPEILAALRSDFNISLAMRAARVLQLQFHSGIVQNLIKCSTCSNLIILLLVLFESTVLWIVIGIYIKCSKEFFTFSFDQCYFTIKFNMDGIVKVVVLRFWAKDTHDWNGQQTSIF